MGTWTWRDKTPYTAIMSHCAVISGRSSLSTSTHRCIVVTATDTSHSRMSVSYEYVARTPCSDHIVVNTQPLGGSRRIFFYNQCERARSFCSKYNHVIHSASTLTNGVQTQFTQGKSRRTEIPCRLPWLLARL